MTGPSILIAVMWGSTHLSTSPLATMAWQRSSELGRYELGPVQARRLAGTIAACRAIYDVPELLTLAVIERESEYRPRARSQKGALGPMQVIPRTAEAMLRAMGEVKKSHDSYGQMVEVGVAYLAGLDGGRGDWLRALTMYNGVRWRGKPSPYALAVVKRWKYLEQRMKGTT